MKKILFTLLFVILFTQIQNSYWKCISYDPETNWCLLTDWSEDEEKKEEINILSQIDEIK